MGSWIFVVWLVIDGQSQEWRYHFDKQYKCTAEYTRILKERLDSGLYESVKAKRCEWYGPGKPNRGGGYQSD